MNEKFFDLKKEKQDRMIHAALKIFSIYGYKHASTDLIVKEAGISKGLLFHYFESKLGLYEFIYEYSVRYLIMEYHGISLEHPVDFFELLQQLEKAKMNAMKVYPYMQQFLNQSIHENVKEALLTLESKKELLENTTKDILNCGDYSKIPPNIDLDMLYNILRYTIDGLLLTRLQEEAFHPEMWYEEVVSYLNLMQKMTYSSKFSEE